MAVIPGVTKATTFFADAFTNSSTLNSATPASPTNNNSTAYQVISSKSWAPTPTIASKDLKFGIASTTGGTIELEALFATNAVALTQNGDFIQLTVTFTNTAGLLTANGSLGFGLYNSGQVKPVAGGLNGTALSTLTTAPTGGAQNWQGYVGQVYYTAANSRILTRAVQTGPGNNNQDLVTTGSTSQSYGNPSGAVIGTAVLSTNTLTVGATYTEVLVITLNDVNSLTISNSLYAGPDTTGTLLSLFGSIATNTTYLTSGFDGLAIGWRTQAATTGGTVMDISSIQVTGNVTPVAGPPVITAQPVPVNVASGGSSVFSVTASGFNLTYQWHRNGTNLLNGGNISGATGSTLVISSASSADVASGANGYYVTVTGTGSFTVNSTTNALALVAAKNLIWAGTGVVWDLNASANWVGGQTFNYGDAVTFDDTGVASGVTLVGSFLSASSMTVSVTTPNVYNFSGSGSFAGTGKLIYNGSGFISIANPNIHTGGTVISNAAAYLDLKNYNGLGTGPLTLAKAGGQMEVEPTGSATLGIAGDVNVADDFLIQFDGTGTFSGVFLGNFSGTVGKTLTLTPKSPFATGAMRFRAYGTNTVCNANIALSGTTTDQAQYNGTVLASYNLSGTQTYNGVISGDGGVMSRAGGSLILNGANTFAGGTTPTSGQIGIGNNLALGTGPLNLAPEIPNLTGSGTVFASGVAHTIANTVQYPSGTNNLLLIIAGTNDLTFSGPFNLNGVDGLGTPTNRTVQVNNPGATTISGVISDGGFSYGFIKAGTGVLYLNNAANTYTSPTIVSAGLLAGSGNILGSVTVATNASIGGGAAAGIGTLTVAGGLTFTNGNGFFRVNRAGSASDLVSVAGVLTNTGNGTITVTNLGATLQVGDTFTLFNKAVIGGGTLSVIGGGATWTNKLAFNGTVQVIPSVNITPTNITAVVNGSTLELSWPADHTGWRLQSQTNSLSTGLYTNWVAVPNTQLNNHYTNAFNPANGAVFYRMIYP